MSWPETVRVKLSSENAQCVSLTPVVVRDMPLRELVELMLGVTGKSAQRVRDLLCRGTLVSGASRFRWAGWDAEPSAIEALLATFPDPDPGRPFSPQGCLRVVLTGPGCRIEVSRPAAERKRFLRRASFWDVLMNLAASAGPQYLEYSYQERSDCYRLEVSSSAAELLRASAGLLSYSSLQSQLSHARIQRLDFYLTR